MRLVFIELPLFTAQITTLDCDHWLNRLQDDLLKQPDKGDLIPRLLGLRKVRMALPGTGKRGGARVIYLHLRNHQAILFFYIYTKAESVNLTPDQERRLQTAVKTIKSEFRHEKP